MNHTWALSNRCLASYSLFIWLFSLLLVYLGMGTIFLSFLPKYLVFTAPKYINLGTWFQAITLLKG